MLLVLKNLKNLGQTQFTLDTKLEEVGFDSLDTIDFIVQVEEKIDSNLLDEDQDKEFKTFRDIHQALERSKNRTKKD